MVMSMSHLVKRLEIECFGNDQRIAHYLQTLYLFNNPKLIDKIQFGSKH